MKLGGLLCFGMLGPKSKIAVLCLAFGMSILLAAWIIPLPARLSSCPSSTVTFNDGIPAHVNLSCDDKWRLNARFDLIDKRYTASLVRFEDKRFWWHFGFDPFSLMRATFQNIRSGKVVSGASTLTMQLVRVLEPRPRTFSSKLVEILRAIQFEIRFSKRRIIEMYLEFAPYGKNIEGVTTASLAYFGHLPNHLSATEIAILLAVPQSPSDRYPTPRNKERLTSVSRNISSRLRDWEFQDNESFQFNAAMIPEKLIDFPRRIPHVVASLSDNLRDSPRIVSSIDLGIQNLAETILAGYRKKLSLQKINNASVLIVEHATGQVRAAIGNFDFWDDKNGGQIVGFKVRRSPGSTLKPVLYAMALDRGLALPETLVPDVPLEFVGFSPKNYDGFYSGLVTFERALSHSLNIPFVHMLSLIGVEDFLAVLRKLGFRSFSSDPHRYGLSSAVGGIEVTAEELAGLYSSFARGGAWMPLQWVDMKQYSSTSTPALSSGAVWMLKKGLSLRDRPDFPFRREINDKSAGIHWKTGTSFGFRDAWAAGFESKYTAVVWLGNFDHSPSAELVGSNSAAPILFDLLEGLGGFEAFVSKGSRPADVIEQRVCSFSGLPANAHCEHTQMSLGLAQKTDMPVCPFHIKVDVDLETGAALTPACRIDRNYESRVFLKMPRDVQRWLSDTGQIFPKLPELADFCENVSSHAPPEILSPEPDRTILLIRGMSPDVQRIALEAGLQASAAKASWFVNGEYLGTVSGHTRLWWTPSLGEHEFTLTDERGQSARRTVKVSSP